MNRRVLSTVVASATLSLGMVVVAAPPALAAGTVSIGSFGTPYSENFDTLASTGSSSAVPTGWDFAEVGTSALVNGLYAAGTGSSTSGDVYSFGLAADRAFGGLLSGTLTPTVGASLTNNTGGTITSLAVAYTGEMWRAGAANRVDRDRIDFQLSTDATNLASGTWTDHDSLDFASPTLSVASPQALDGNAPANRTAISAIISDLSIPDGSTVWIRWSDFNIAGSDDGLAVDDFSLTANGVIPDEEAPAVDAVSPADGATDVPVATNLSVTFSEPVTLAGDWFTLSCATSGARTVGDTTVTGGPTTFTIDPTTDFATGEACSFTVEGSLVSDQDLDDPPDNMAADVTTSFTTELDVCALPYTPAYAIQGSGSAAAITGPVTTHGVVVGDYEYPGGAAANSLRGFYLQDPAGDGNAATSDAVFVFNGNNNSVNLGDIVRVAGTAGEFQDQTQVGATSVRTCGTGSVGPTDVTFPVASPTALEAFEGMLVRIPQTMYVTEHFQLGRFGQVVVSAGGRLPQPTNVVAPGGPAQTLQAENNLRKIIVDDATQAQNPDPILFARNGQPLSAANTLRGGDTATGITGVMTYTWAGNAASPNAYRVRPLGALGGSVTFEAVNERPAGGPEVGGDVRVVGMNLLNFFNTFNDGSAATPGCFPGGGDSDCRGANSAFEFERQTAKTIAAIVELDPDVLGVNELENDGYGPASSIQYLVDQLNAATAPGTYDFIDVDAASGQVNSMGTDAIRVALLYKPGVVTPVGTTAPLNSVAFVNGGDASPRNRATVIQAFEVNSTGAVFIVAPNHLKSKGSACTAPDAGDGQGNCNQVRVNAATALLAFLDTDPTGTDDPDVLLVGDLNSYAKEDPVTTLKDGGFTNLIERFLGPDAYSYVFDGQWGYLDHALASASLVNQVDGVGEYHINADEPTVLDYNTDFKSAGQVVSLYAPDEFRVSDHDPVLVGLTPNAPPTVDAGGPYSVNEGGSATLTASGADANGDTLTYEWDLDGNGTFETSGSSVTFSAALLDGPTTRTVGVRVTDTGGLSATDTASVVVVNVAPTVVATFASPSVACGVSNATLTVTFLDPGVADTHTAVIDWGDGTTETIAGATSPLIRTHTYASAGTYTAEVTVTDDDGGSGGASADVAVNYTSSGVRPPLSASGTEVANHGSTVPVKVRFTDCDGSVPTDLAPLVSVLSLPNGTEVHSGAMRFSDGQWIYNLKTRSLPDPTGTYRIVITVPETGQQVTADIRLR